MNRELEKYYEGQFDMFISTGWKDLIEDLSKLRESVSDITKVEDAQSLHFRQGQIDILDLLLNRKVMCEKSFEELQDA
jgi:hypothetical protein